MRSPQLYSLVFLAISALGADWPMGGRTADRNPVSLEMNPPTDWQITTADAQPRNIKWSAELGSRSIGGPVVAGGLVWVGTNDYGTDDTNEKLDHAILACFRESDGKLLHKQLFSR